MPNQKTNKLKILNDPVYGFITLRHEKLLDIIDHPYFQRLRRISQLGLSHLVYPGATHNRFHHAIGAVHLMQIAIEEIRQKGVSITDEESEAVCIAILLHDVGHGPFSHALEHTLVQDIHHEELSTFIMNRLNEEFNGGLDMAISIFNDHYEKKFLHQLVSSQLDMDRLDYLKRDSFYSGVTEGQVGSQRIIKMLNVVNDELVVEEKGIYSIEKYIVARRLMYWQVYLHKTVISAEFMLVNVLKRARELKVRGDSLFATPALDLFLSKHHTKEEFLSDPVVLDTFCDLDDFDVMSSIKTWCKHEDLVLRELSQRLVNRKLFKIKLKDRPFPDGLDREFIEKISAHFGISKEDAKHFLVIDKIDNRAYNTAAQSIKIKFKDGSILDVAQASDHLNLSALSELVEKYFFAFPLDAVN